MIFLKKIGNNLLNLRIFLIFYEHVLKYHEHFVNTQTFVFVIYFIKLEHFFITHAFLQIHEHSSNSKHCF